ncbi:MAG: prolipoprotein diacylglyceryl transferase [Gammaproteobacteria bacterium]|nr:prolipoprotein diacylglyceryl transferase [Gammaproteobacteria bacterium]
MRSCIIYSHFESGTWVTPFGLIFLAAIFVAWLLARRNATAAGIDGSHIDLLMPITIIVGVAGALLLSLVMPMDRMVAGDMMQTGVRARLFSILATGAVAVFIYSRIVKLSFRRLLDIFALPTIAGLMVHRVGCFLAGCCWGDVVSDGHVMSFATQVQTLPFLGGLTAGVQYPPGSLPYEQHVAMGLIEPGAVVSLPIYPVQLYEVALLLVLLLALWRLPGRGLPNGVLTVVVVCAYALLRFVIEYLRADGSIVLGNLTLAQLQCLVLLCSAALLPVLMRQPARGRATAS